MTPPLSKLFGRSVCIASLALLASCGDGEPTEGQSVSVKLSDISVPAREQSKVPLNIINAQGNSGPLHDLGAFVEHLKADKFTVEQTATSGMQFRGVTDNKINIVSLTDYEVVEVIAKRQKDGRNTGIKETITAKFINGTLNQGWWVMATWQNPTQEKPLIPIPYTPPDLMEINSKWASNTLLKPYGLPALKGESAMGGLIERRPFRKEDSGEACFHPDGTVAPAEQCGGLSKFPTITISYRARYKSGNNGSQTTPVECWEGVCVIETFYLDRSVTHHTNGIYSALGAVYREKFGEVDPPKPKK